MTLRQLGDYVLMKPLGYGSMGTTYLAEHRLIKRLCVLKVLPPELSTDTSFIHRFENEVFALSSLDHPHIVKIHNVSSAEGHCFLVTDSVVDGDGNSCNLWQFLVRKKEKFSEEQLVQLARQIGSALDYAHERKMGVEPFAHGMLKFSNILVRPSKQGWQCVLSDFGLSRIIGPGAVLSRTYKAVAEQLANQGGLNWNKKGEDRYVPGKTEGHAIWTLHESFLHNFAFLAPEQKYVMASRTTPVKADIYAFGVLFYYLLCEEMPEGFFQLPKKKGDQKWHWDILLAQCLQKDPTARPDLLLPLIEEITTPPAVFIPSINESMAKAPVLEESKESVSLTPLIKDSEIARPAFEPNPGEIFQKELTVGRYHPEKKVEKSVQPLLTQMVVIPGGTYLRGSQQGARDEMPRHALQMNPFAIDVHPVTNEQFVLFLEAMGGEKDANNHDIIRLRDSRIKKNAGRLNIESGYLKHPVVGVTWYGAIAYAKWIGKRLPTEAEWEIAAYGGKEDAFFPTGETIERTQANFFSSDTTAVGSYSPNDYGLYDMAGNVYEWCQDWYDYHYYDISVQEPNHPMGPLQGVYRVLRGGCWKSLKEDLRCAHRHRNNPGVMNGTYGFRCAADVSNDE